ncbi:proto-oncogene DBL isoform X1 [Gymnodraco acuticeps]|uniref:Proto-oncogene DBL isoform X1 n=2 Tax=Gymnodraco acuticeps TaxID=8218 RepID=A0A6P8TVI9_GYMAC|nr:proto-oncogene DBL isoform X1 [Gymnodraco acuticeps]
MAESNPMWGFPRLRRAATSFPGNLHLVLVLGPSGLLSSAPSPSSSTDLGFRFSQDDFLLKMPVVMLRSVGDLLRYIDEHHLTSDFTAKVEYCQSDWVLLRQAIETFAVTVKKIAQHLQGFGAELSETDLPDEANAIEFLLHSHTHRYRQMKDDIRSVLKEGRLLLSNLETVKASKRDVDAERDLKSDMDTVQRLLAQLRDMEEAFDGFFEKHHLKLQQYLQLLHYEMRFHKMEEVLEKITAKEADIDSVGTTVVQTEQLLMDLEILDANAQEEMARAQVLILHGHQLAANHHYALALIVQRCNELRHRCDLITAAVRIKRASLTRAQDLLLRLEGALRWCDEGAYLLASQMVDRFQTREGAQEALQYLTYHQERAPSALKNNQDIVSLELEAILTPQLQSQISMVAEKLNSMQSMIRNREQCLKKLADVQIRPIQLVAPRPEHTSQRCKSPLFSPKHGVDFNVLNSKFSFDLLPGKRAARKNNNQRKIEVMHDFQGNRSCLYGSTTETDSEAEDNPEQVTRHVMKELIATERIYVDELLSVLLGYRAEMEDPSMSNLLPSALRSQKDVLFGNMPEIYQFHSRIFLQDLQSCLETPERVGACFLQRKKKFQVYQRYCQNKPRSELLWRQCSDSTFFKECQKKLDHKLGLDSYLLKPVQRLAKYQLLLKELLKHCTEDLYRCELQEALDSMLELLKSVNDSMHQIAITGYQADLSQLGRVVLQGGFSVWISHKRAAVRMKELARFKPMQRHLFLYELALLFCKRRDEDNHERMPYYSFKSCLRMSAVGITENVKGDVKKFEIWYSGREVVYIVQAPTLEIKVAWLTEIRKILTNQQKNRHDEALTLSDNPLSDSASVMCVSWGGASVGGCSACLPVPNSSSTTSHSHMTRGEESIYTSPAHSEPVVNSPRRTWPVPAHTVAICEGLEDWGAATDLSNLSDSDEEDQPSPLVVGRYRVLVESSMASTDDIIFNCGDVIQLLHEEMSGMWMVRNISRKEEGRVLPEDLHRILGETC